MIYYITLPKTKMEFFEGICEELFDIEFENGVAKVELEEGAYNHIYRKAMVMYGNILIEEEDTYKLRNGILEPEFNEMIYDPQDPPIPLASTVADEKTLDFYAEELKDLLISKGYVKTLAIKCKKIITQGLDSRSKIYRKVSGVTSKNIDDILACVRFVTYGHGNT